MRRIFGSKKEKVPAPSIDEANGKLTTRGDVYGLVAAARRHCRARRYADAKALHTGLTTKSGSSMSSL